MHVVHVAHQGVLVAEIASLAVDPETDVHGVVDEGGLIDKVGRARAATGRVRGEVDVGSDDGQGRALVGADAFAHAPSLGGRRAQAL